MQVDRQRQFRGGVAAGPGGTWVAVAFTPIVLVYQSWTYWVFRKRVGRASIPDSQGLFP